MGGTTSSSHFRKWLAWLLLAVGLGAAFYSLQSVALWLPFSRVFQFATNATVWPQVQLFTILMLGLVGLALYLLQWRRTGLAFIGIAGIAILPSLQMLLGLAHYAAQHDVHLPLSSHSSLIRTQEQANEPHLKYGRGGQTDLYLASYLTSKPSPHPAIVYVHGGGWSGGSRTENSQFFKWLNRHGYDVFSVDYRFARDDYASWQDAPRDVACSLAWLNAHVTRYNIDPSRVSIMGDSAGGQIALRAAYGLKNGDVSSSCGGSPIVPRSVVGIVPATDFRELYDDPQRGATSRANIVRYLGGTPENLPWRYDEASILTHVKPGLMPTLILSASHDTLVSPESGVRLAEALKGVNVKAEQYTLPYAVHSYWINPGGYQNMTSQKLIQQFLEDS